MEKSAKFVKLQSLTYVNMRYKVLHRLKGGTTFIPKKLITKFVGAAGCVAVTFAKITLVSATSVMNVYSYEEYFKTVKSAFS